jgi:hypothetical protein
VEPPATRGPYRGDEFGRRLLQENPDSDWVRRAGIQEPHELLDAMGKADHSAEAAYKNALKEGMSDASAHQVSQDAWHEAFNQHRPRWRTAEWNAAEQRWTQAMEPPRAGPGQTQPPQAPAEIGPYQSDPLGRALLEANRDTDAVAYMGGQKTIDAVKMADEAAARSYAEMRAGGMSQASANQVSRDVWHDAFNRNRATPIGAPVQPPPQGGQTQAIPPQPGSGAGSCGSPLAKSVGGISEVSGAVGGLQ